MHLKRFYHMPHKTAFHLAILAGTENKLKLQALSNHIQYLKVFHHTYPSMPAYQFETIACPSIICTHQVILLTKEGHQEESLQEADHFGTL